MRAIDLVPRVPEYVCMGAASGAGAAVAGVSEYAVQILGVPLPVLLAAFSAACIARAYAEEKSFLRAAVVTGCWTVLGCGLAPVAQWVTLAVSVKFGFGLEQPLPPNVLAGFAALVASAGWWVPKLWPYIAARFFGGKGGGNA